MGCSIAVLSPSQRGDVGARGHNFAATASDGILSSQRSIIPECQSPVAADRLPQTVKFRQSIDEVTEQLVAGRPHPETSRVAEKRASKQLVSTVHTSSLHLGDSASPASSLACTSQQSTTQRPVKLNGISDTDKSLSTCSGTYCRNYCHSI